MTPFAKEATLSNCTRDKERAIEYQETSSKEGCRGKIFEEKEGQESQQDPERVSRHWSNNIKLCQECCWGIQLAKASLPSIAIRQVQKKPTKESKSVWKWYMEGILGMVQ